MEEPMIMGLLATKGDPVTSIWEVDLFELLQTSTTIEFIKSLEDRSSFFLENYDRVELVFNGRRKFLLSRAIE